MVELKRFFFIVPIILISLLFILDKLMDNLYFFYGTIFITFSILFWNIPFLIIVLHTTPVYYEDLKIISTATNTDIYNLQSIFSGLNGFISSIFITMIIFYILTTYKIKDYSIIELLGIIGGLGSFYLKIQAILGKSLLTILFTIKESDEGGIEMVNTYTAMSSNSSSNSSMDDISRQSYGSVVMNDLWRSKKNSPINGGSDSDIISLQSICAIQNSWGNG